MMVPLPPRMKHARTPLITKVLNYHQSRNRTRSCSNGYETGSPCGFSVRLSGLSPTRFMPH